MKKHWRQQSGMIADIYPCMRHSHINQQKENGNETCRIYTHQRIQRLMQVMSYTTLLTKDKSVEEPRSNLKLINHHVPLQDRENLQRRASLGQKALGRAIFIQTMECQFSKFLTRILSLNSYSSTDAKIRATRDTLWGPSQSTCTAYCNNTNAARTYQITNQIQRTTSIMSSGGFEVSWRRIRMG